jgi:pimeloyl-ACP methyl ester carboxylesterase
MVYHRILTELPERVAVLLVLSLITAGSVTAASALRLTDTRPCPGMSGFTCSTLTVPLDHAGQRRGSLRLQVAAADNVSAPRGVLLVLAGGPGQPGVPHIGRFARALAGALTEYRLVMYDQRGTGAGALQCPALQAAMGGSDLYPPPETAVRACARALGANRALYGTDDVLADMELLRQVLGVNTWTLDGVSYGTFVAERYSIVHPERVGRLVLDSVVPHNAGFELVPLQLHAAGRVLRLACHARCADDLARVVRQGDDGPKLLDALALLSIVDPSFSSALDLPTVLDRAARGSKGRLNSLLRTIKAWEAAPAAELSQGLHASALCADWRFPWGGARSPLARRGARLAGAAALLRTRDIWPFDRATAMGNGVVRECLPWPPTTPTPSVARRLPRKPTLLLAGDRDLSTPLEWARRELRVAPAGRLVTIRGAGHSVQNRASSDLGRKTVVSFLLRS